MTRTRKNSRRACRRSAFRNWRALNRPTARSLPGFGRGPSELSQALSAFTCVRRCHRRLVQLAPRFFDPAVVARETREREEKRERMANCEAALLRVYGPAPASAPPSATLSNLPPLPDLHTQRAVERELTKQELWMAVGRIALDRYLARRPHALPRLSQLARLLDIAVAFGHSACGLESPHPEPALPKVDFEADLKRAYGEPNPTPSPAQKQSFGPVVPPHPTKPVTYNLKPETAHALPNLDAPYPPTGPTLEQRRQHDVWTVPLKFMPGGYWASDWSRAKPV